MAKGNLLLGTAGNSVGDVVMYRREGAQVSRVRVRKVKNPKTAAQSTQRAFFAPVAKFYSPLAIVLERSFEGLSKSKSYSKFLKTNVDLARENDWLLPKGTGFFPLPYMLSQGSLPSIPQHTLDGGSLMIGIPHVAETATTIGDFSKDLMNAGANKGDIVTIILCNSDMGNENYYPLAFQFEVNPASTDTLASIVPANVSFTWESEEEAWMIENTKGHTKGGALILARFENNVWRRSTTFLKVSFNLMERIDAADYKAAAVASYGATNTGDNPLVYLDGEELTNV